MADTIPGNPTTTAVLPIGQLLLGTGESARDSDWYRVELQAGTNYGFYGYPTEIDVYGWVELRDGSGRLLRASEAGGEDGIDGGFDFRPATSGTYFVAMTSYDATPYELYYEVDIPASRPTDAVIEVGASRSEELLSWLDVDLWRVHLEMGRTYDLGSTDRVGC
jgi:hypothetical protein